MVDTLTSPLIKRLQDQRAAAWEEAKRYIDSATNNNGNLGENEEPFKRANEAVDRFGALIKGEIERMQEARDLEAAFQAAIAKGKGPEKPGAPAGQKSLAQRMREDLKASERGETRAGGIYSPIPEARAAADLAVGTTGSGAEFVPTTLVNRLYEKMFADSAILRILDDSILRTGNGDPIKLPRMTALNDLGTGAPGAGQVQVNEGGTIQESEPNFDQVELNAYKYAQICEVTRELVEDSVIDVETYLGRYLGRMIGRAVGYFLVRGSGTSQPKGVRVHAAANKIDSAAGGLFPTTDFDKFFDVIALLNAEARQRGVWIVNDGAQFTLRKIKMNGVYAWEPNLQGAGMPPRFLGYPVYTDPNVPVPATAAGVSAIFMDPEAYMIRLVRDVRIEWSMEQAWTADKLAVKAVLRVDGDAIDEGGIAGFNSVT
jgi:HK97 family phage major capsid protein